MNSQDFRSLQEAYMEVVMNELDEGKSSRPRYPGGRGVLDQETRDEKREAHVENRKGHTAGPGTVTKNPKKLRKQKAMGEIGENFDIYDIILSHLLDEGYAETPEAAEAIMVNMSEEWREDIVESAADQSDKQIEKGVKTTYKAQNVIDNQHQGRSRGLNRLPANERRAKIERMRDRLKSRRDDLFQERGKREDEKREKLKKMLGL